jgi:hypothetical protein
VYELDLELIKALSLIYTYLLVFALCFAYPIRVDKVFIEVIDHLISYRKGVSNTRLVSSVQVTLSVSFNTIEDIIYTSILICVMVGIDLEFADDLDLPVFVSRVSAVIELRGVRDSCRAELTVLGDSRSFSFDRRNRTVNGSVVVFRSVASSTSNLASHGRASSRSVVIIQQACEIFGQGVQGLAVGIGIHLDLDLGLL